MPRKLKLYHAGLYTWRAVQKVLARMGTSVAFTSNMPTHTEFQIVEFPDRSEEVRCIALAQAHLLGPGVRLEPVVTTQRSEVGILSRWK